MTWTNNTSIFTDLTRPDTATTADSCQKSPTPFTLPTKRRFRPPKLCQNGLDSGSTRRVSSQPRPKWPQHNKIEDYELFADENQSGTKTSRPGLDRMMKAVENGEIHTVIVFAFSRYARSVTHMLKGLEVMRKFKTNFVSLTEKLDLNTSLGHVVFVIISAIAQLERDLIAERVRNGLRAAKARGAKIGRERKRNSALIENLLDAGFSFRTIARLAKCSHGSVSAQKKEWLAKKALLEAQIHGQTAAIFTETQVEVLAPDQVPQVQEIKNISPEA